MKRYSQYSAEEDSTGNLHEMATSTSSSSSATLDSETAFSAGVHQGTGIVLSEEEIIKLLLNDPLVKMCREEISQLCNVIYGKAGILQKQLDDMIENPAFGAGLSQQILEAPRSLGNLAGSSVCGIKNGARQRAEVHVNDLSNTVKHYEQAVVDAREKIRNNPEAEIKRYEGLAGSKVLSEILQPLHQHALTWKFLRTKDLVDMAKEHPAVRRCSARIAYWSDRVFGDSDILQEQKVDILYNPSIASEYVRQISNNPQSFGNFAGVDVCGVRSRARVQAETGLANLVQSIENFADAVQQVQDSIIKDCQEKQRRCELSVKLARRSHQQDSWSVSSSPEHSPAAVHHEVAGPSREAHGRVQSSQPRSQKSSTLAFAH